MSRYTVGRLPLNVLHILNVYERVSNLLQPLDKSLSVQNLLNENSPFHHNLARHKLVHNAAAELQFNSNDFPPLVSHLIKPLFNTPICLSASERRTTDEIFAGLKTDDTLDSRYTATAKRHTDFQAQIMTSLASHYSPMDKIPLVVSVANSHRWYTRLLQRTPIILFLRQKQRLFSHSSLHQLNKPLADFRHQLGALNAEVAGDNTRFRSHHMGNITTKDILSIATRDLDRDLQATAELCSFLASATDPRIINDSEANAVPDSLKEAFPIREVYHRLLDGVPLAEFFPFDLTYNDVYCLTIELAMVAQFDGRFMQLLEQHKDDFEVSMARFSLDTPEVASFFNAGVANAVQSQEYEGLLKAAQNSSTNISMLAEYMGQRGLVRALQGHNCIILR